MKHKLSIILLLLLIKLSPFSLAQEETYTVAKAPFSSPEYDEFSPVYYRNFIVFCSNRKPSMLVNNSDSLDKGLMKINFIDTTGRNKWRRPRLFSRDLTTPFNDGPVTFNRTFDTIYFSRNLIADRKLGKLPGPKNRLGIFYAVRDSNKWVRIKEMRINNDWYNVTTPWLSPDGKRLYFASDKPDGYGGSDLWYCQWKNDYWDNPVNLGPVINTPGNEGYPFVNAVGELFFSSDGHAGMGGKDIFFSRLSDTVWLPPVPLDPPVNSVNDDFGFITDPLTGAGYFSSVGDGSVDIFEFTTNFPQIFYSEEQRSNIYCFRFRDTVTLKADPSRLQYEWEFGDGTKATGQNVEHCFSGPGKYTVRENITDRKTKRVIFTILIYDIELKDIEQPYITSADAVLAGENIEFNSLKSYLPGYEIVKHTWDMGDSSRLNESAVSHIFREPGVKTVRLGLLVRNTSTGAITMRSVFKKIAVCRDARELDAYNASVKKTIAATPDVTSYDHASVNIRYSAAEDLKKDAVFHIELMSSDKRINPDNENFKKAGQNYSIREIFLKESGRYSYVIGEEFSLMAAYPALNEAIAMGFKDAMIKTAILKDPAEKELSILKRVYGLSSDMIFERGSIRITQGGFAFLDQIATLLKKYPAARISLEVHSDEQGTNQFNQDLSEKRVQAMAVYLGGRGISTGRLLTRGFGRANRLATGENEESRRLNNRVQFLIIH